MRQVIFMFLLLAVPSAGFSATIHVPDDYLTIQEAIDAAVNGDTVLVAPGTYVENIDFIGKAITVKSSDGAEATVIDGGNPVNPDYGSCAFFGSGEDSNSILEGFKLTNGIGTGSYSPLNGGGIYCKASSPTIMNNTISGNSAVVDGAGGGIYCEASSPTITNNTISENQVVVRGIGGGGGIFCTDSSSPTIMNNTISGNMSMGSFLFPYPKGNGGGIYCSVSSSPTIMNNTISGNTAGWGNGGGIFCSDSSPTIMNNTISGNSAVAGYGGGIYAGLNSSVNVLNTILWDNSNYYGYGPEIAIGSYYYPSTLSISYSDVKGGQRSVRVERGSTLNWGRGMIDKDPLLTMGPNGFLYLSQIAAGQRADSPCLDSGSDLAGNLGMDIYWTRTDEIADAGTVDMGYHYGSFLFPPLQADVLWIPENVGGTVNFLLLAGAQNANRTYLLLGSISGTDPGTPLPGGTATLPLNWDHLTTVILQNLNTSAFHDFMGVLDINGSGAAQLNIRLAPGTAGITMYFAYCLNNPFDFVSNPIAVKIVL